MLDSKDPNLLQRIQTEYLDRKIAGEDTNKVLLFLVCLSAFTKGPLSAVVKGVTGAGKSRIVNRVLDIFRRMGVVIEFSRITGAYLENMAKSQATSKPVMRKEISNEEYVAELKAWREQPRRIDLSGKILFIDELRGITNSQSPKLLISEGRLRLGTVINGEPVEIEVVGTPSVITTTTLASMQDPEFENRIIPMQIDESAEQTNRVLDYEADGFEDPSEDYSEEPRTKALLDLLQGLKPYEVANPYAHLIKAEYPSSSIESRRDFPKLMSSINVVAWLYQEQRRKARKGLTVAVVAEPQDIEIVRALAEASLRESLSGVSAKEDAILAVLTDASEKDSFGTVTGYEYLTIKEIHRNVRRQVRKGEQWVRDHVDRLCLDGYVEEHPDNKPGKKGQRFRFAELSPETLNIRADEYAKQVTVDSWAQERGWQLLDEGHVLREENTMTGQPKDRPLGGSGLTDSPNSDFGLSSKPADEFGTGPGSGDIVFSHSKTGHGGALPKVEPPFVELGSCALCEREGPRRPDHHHEFLVCQACFDATSPERIKEPEK
ncbi:MAG TPA: hypothetical protein VFE98_10930 [Candidatus Bathyarchaeia archaeon]|nr:hypothetical protein [Candidatus Bathyarchaeia archaeon]